MEKSQLIAWLRSELRRLTGHDYRIDYGVLDVGTCANCSASCATSTTRSTVNAAASTPGPKDCRKNG